MVKGIGQFRQYLHQDIIFFKRSIYFTCFTMISQTIGLTHELGGAYHGNRINKISFLQNIFYKADGVIGGVQYLFYLGNRLAFGCTKRSTKKYQ